MSLRWYQTDAANAALAALRDSPLVEMPTGSGKSHVIAEVARRVHKQWGVETLVLAHRKELLEQNAAKIRAAGIECGIYSAGLGVKDSHQPVICAGIQSATRSPERFEGRKLLIVDEAHLIPSDGEGMYRKLIGYLRERNPNLRLMGLTATPFRLDSGKLWGEGQMFGRLAYTVPTRRLMQEGWLAPLTNSAGQATPDTSRAGLVAGEFVAKEMAEIFAPATPDCVREAIAAAVGRYSILVFTSGVEHAEEVAHQLEKETRDEVRTVTGDMPPLERASAIESFKAGRARWLVNVDVLTTGFDCPRVDAIVLLRATASPGLFVQICGRGLRTAPEKTDCLILDFGGNLKRHGPIDAPNIPGQWKREQRDKKGQPIVKPCPACGKDCAARAKSCECGFRFPERLEARDAASGLLADEAAATLDVVRTEWMRWEKKGKPNAPPTLRVTYWTT